MSPLPSGLTRQVRAVAASIDESGAAEASPSEAPLPAIATLLRLESAIAYNVELVDGRSRIDTALTFRQDHMVDVFDGFLARAPRQFGSYDPAHPEPRQRNRALRLRELGADADSVVVRELYPQLGLAGKSQLRVLVCEGPTLLGWVGGWRDEEFSDVETRALEALVPPLRRRLRLMAWTGRDGLHFESLRVALDAIGAPAFLTRIDGLPVHANASGRCALDSDSCRVIDRLKAAAHGGEPSLQVSPLRAPGLPTHLLIVLPAGEADAGVHVASVAKKWSLTPRQAEVLALVVRGEANKTIAATLGCSVRTIEVHLTALFEKSQCDSRAELGARFRQTR
jgi:DNA-binding CsgD family transcriptional regulator